MRWRGRSQSGNVEDRRGMSVGGLATGGGVIGVIIYLLVSFLGGDPGQIPVNMGTQQQAQSPEQTAAEDTLAQFVSVVLAETENAWTGIFRQQGIEYQAPVLVLYRGQVVSGCGQAGSSTGPFYCPADGKLYIDLSFYELLRQRFGAPGDFAMAYVVAHEVGHHVQNLLGLSDQMQVIRQRSSEAEYNRYSVRVELQADYYAGVWAHYAGKSDLLESGDIEEALKAASAVGDDNLQRRGGGDIQPESFTHGTSQQRMKWFSLGYKYGDLEHGDTFNQPI
jgi:predicted metalloprotease